MLIFLTISDRPMFPRSTLLRKYRKGRTRRSAIEKFWDIRRAITHAGRSGNKQEFLIVAGDCLLLFLPGAAPQRLQVQMAQSTLPVELGTSGDVGLCCVDSSYGRDRINIRPF